MTGVITLNQVMDNLAMRKGEGLCIVAPEQNLGTNSAVRVIQENLLLLHKLNKPFKVGFLINVHRFPLGDENKMELLMGLNLCQ